MTANSHKEEDQDDESSPPPIPLPAGTLLQDEYRIEEVLGRGAFGITYRACDENLATDVAIKEYHPRPVASRVDDTLQVRPPSSAATEEFEYGLRQFLEEGRTVAQFDHPNVVDVRSFFEENGTGYLVMDYYEGQSLVEYLDENGGYLSEGEAIGLLLDVLDGLQQVHEAGVLHRDITPQNIHRTREGEPLLLDFGAARQAVVAKRQDLSDIVKPGYAPIEQYSADGDRDARTDLYACAATFYRCLTGTTPPPAPERTREDQLEPPEQVRPEISSDTSLAVRKGLAISPEQRPQSAQAFADLLRTAASMSEELEPSSPPEAQTAPSPDPPPSGAVPPQSRDDESEPKGRTVPYTLIGVGLLAAVAAAVLYWSPTDLFDTPTAPELGPRSVAVLPFTYLAREDSTDYFSLGMTDGLVTRLSQVEDLSVIARSSAMQYRGSAKPIPEIGRELGVAYVVKGSVQKAGGQVRVRLQLLRTRTGDVVWAESFTRPFQDVLQLQADLTQQAARKLKDNVLPSTRRQIEQTAPVDSAAYALYLQARKLRFEQTPASTTNAVDLLRQSVAADSTFAPAWALLSYCAWSAPAGLPEAVDPDSLARTAAQRALALDSTSAEAHIALGVIRQLLDQNFSAAGPPLHRAVELNPNLANANREYGLYLTRLAQYEAAAPYLEKAARLNPASPAAFVSLGQHHLFRENYERAGRTFQKAVSLQPNSAMSHSALSLVYAQQGKQAKAVRRIRRASDLQLEAPELGYLGWAYAHMGRRDSARAVLSRLQGEFASQAMAPVMRGAIHAALGHPDRALDQLEQTRSGSIFLKGLPLFDALRDRPRFQRLLEARGLDDASVRQTMETLQEGPYQKSG